MSGASEWFGTVAEAYARHRLDYPEPFFEAFRERLPRGSASTVWDCGCGNGQASRQLAEQVGRVFATDASPEQLQVAFPHPRVHYSCAPAEASGLPDRSVDGVLVAAAVHWFAGEAFDREVRRVCRSGAVMAWIGYLPPRLQEERLHALLDRFINGTLGPWWPPERILVERGYADLTFPGQEWPFPSDLQIERHWTLADLLGCLGTWSAVVRARQEGQWLLPQLERELRPLWPDGGEGRVRVLWPFIGRWGRVSGALP